MNGREKIKSVYSAMFRMFGRKSVQTRPDIPASATGTPADHTERMGGSIPQPFRMIALQDGTLAQKKPMIPKTADDLADSSKGTGPTVNPKDFPKSWYMGEGYFNG